MTNSEWLAQLKAGDEVIVSGTHTMTLDTVTRTTKTLIIVEKNRRFNRKRGRPSGSGYYGPSLEQPTPEKRRELADHIAKNTRKSLAYQCRDDVDWRKLSFETLTKVLELVRETPKDTDR